MSTANRKDGKSHNFNKLIMQNRKVTLPMYTLANPKDVKSLNFKKSPTLQKTTPGSCNRTWCQTLDPIKLSLTTTSRIEVKPFVKPNTKKKICLKIYGIVSNIQKTGGWGKSLLTMVL